MNTPQPSAHPDQPARALLKEIQDKYPVFRDHLPLAIGIDKELRAAQPDLDRKLLRVALRIHTNSLRYLKGMEKATSRFALDGSVAAEVSEEHRTHASEILRERFKKNAERRKVQRQAEEAQRKEDEAARRHADKLNQLAAKFSRHGR